MEKGTFDVDVFFLRPLAGFYDALSLKVNRESSSPGAWPISRLFYLIMGIKYKPCCCPGLCYIRERSVSGRHYRRTDIFLSTETERI